MAAKILGAGIVRLDRRKKEPLHRQIYEGIREAILSANLDRGAALPASRSLAEQLNVSRMTVVNAYEQLLAEGYLESRTGSGTFVNRELPDDRKMVRFLRGTADNDLAESPNPRRARLNLSRRGQRLAASYEGERPSFQDQPALFSLGIPALDEFPLDVWTKLCRDRGRVTSSSDLKYQQASGWMPLRRAICDYTKVFRGVRCNPEQVFITAGTQQAIELTIQMLLDPGDSVLFENPGYWRARAALQASGAKLIPLPVDSNGASIRACRPAAKNAKLIYVTPSHQFPMGVTMSIERRIELLNWAYRYDAAIIEDDYDSVFSYSQPPIPSLQGLDPNERTFYMGSLSKLLFPSLGIGYVIVPPALVDKYETAFKIVGRTPALLMQQVVHDFIQQGHFERHIRRMRKIYEQRHSALVDAIERLLPTKLKLVGSDAGLHHTGLLLNGRSDTAVARRIKGLRIHVQPLSIDSLTSSAEHNGLVFGFGCGSPAEIGVNIRRIASAI